MARRRFVQINGELVEVTNGHSEPRSAAVMGDIQPYQSMIDGSMITSRSQHREHLLKHGCREVGNDAHAIAQRDLTASRDTSPQKRHELIRSQIDAMTHREFRSALKRDIDRVKWQSRER